LQTMVFHGNDQQKTLTKCRLKLARANLEKNAQFKT
jgi:hypothetical protein